MRLFADTNIVAPAVSALRADGHDVVYSGEWDADPGDAAILDEARKDDRILVTKDHDIGELVFKRGMQHVGVLLIDDLGSVVAELALIRTALLSAKEALEQGKFVRAGESGVRVAD